MSQQEITVTSQGLRLRGVLTLPEGVGPFPGVVLCHPHPLYGGNMDNKVVLVMESALVRRGFATLRFNFRGAGGSEGAHDYGRGEQQDALAALQCLADAEGVDAQLIGLAGYSFGAAVALLAASKPSLARGVAAVACPPALVLQRVKDVAIPVLLVAGAQDELATPEDLLALAPQFSVPAQVVAVPGADHFFQGHEGDVSRAVGAFFERWLQESTPGAQDAPGP
ncbi:MAG: alpha/beta hydrolase [Dehalococcoidia bacterium]|nr:alpha/beta hydrolase [Dehalococcoidia bacterium]